MRERRSETMSRRVSVAAVAGLVLTVTGSTASAQVPCVRHELEFSCADGSRIAIVDDASRGGGFRGHRGGGHGAPGFEAGRSEWWKDDHAIHGPGGQQCLLHGNHVHCGTLRED
jgi:hypothetical protein